MLFVTFFGLLSAVLWVASSIAWVWAARVQAPVTKASSGLSNAIVMSDDPNPELSIGGIRVANFNEVDSYNKAVAYRNQLAAWISAAAAVCSGISILLSQN